MSFNYPFGEGIILIIEDPDILEKYELHLTIYGVEIFEAVIPETMHFYCVKIKMTHTAYWIDPKTGFPV